MEKIIIANTRVRIRNIKKPPPSISFEFDMAVPVAIAINRFDILQSSLK